MITPNEEPIYEPNRVSQVPIVADLEPMNFDAFQNFQNESYFNSDKEEREKCDDYTEQTFLELKPK